jgi:hypothetical protein
MGNGVFYAEWHREQRRKLLDKWHGAAGKIYRIITPGHKFE